MTSHQNITTDDTTTAAERHIPPTSLEFIEWAEAEGKERKRQRKWALRQLADEAHLLEATSPGGRDDQLIQSASRMGGLVNMEFLVRDDVHDKLRPAVQKWGDYDDDLAQDKIDRCIDDAIRDDITLWREWNEYRKTLGGIRAETPRRRGVSETSLRHEVSDTDDDSTPVFADRGLTRSDLRKLPEPEPLIDNVLDQGTTALLYGSWSTAKTFIALDWALCVATGKRWQSREVRQRRVLYVVGEGVNGFDQRVDAWEIGWKAEVSDEQITWYPHPVNLTNEPEVNNLRAFIEWGGYSFVILDTLARCMVGADENSAKDCGVVVDAMTKLLASTPDGRGVILGVHHAGKDGKTLRGSSAFESGVDTVYSTSREEHVISLIRQKRKDGPEHDHHMLQLDPIEGTESCVVSQSHGWSHPLETVDRTATLRLIMSQHFGLTGATSAQLRQLAVDDGGMTKSTFYRAVSDLLKSGWLVNTGTDKRPFYFIKD